MGRSRNIKPGFFSNENLAKCMPLSRILFAGLWTVADREGLLEDRPLRLKVQLLPYDDCDVESLLQELESHHFIQRYIVDGVGVISVLNFKKHQNPHIREAKSELPLPPSKGSVEAQPFPEKAMTSTAFSPPRSPDSLLPLTDSLNPHSLTPASQNTALPAQQDFEIFLCQQWGEDGRRMPWATKQQLLKLIEKHGRERVDYAIEEAAKHNKRSLAYVEAILSPEARARNALRRDQAEVDKFTELLKPLVDEKQAPGTKPRPLRYPDDQ